MERESARHTAPSGAHSLRQMQVVRSPAAMTAGEEPLDEQIRQRRAQLGRELSANLYVSEAQHDLVIAPRVWHATPDAVLSQRPPTGATHTPLVYQATGVRLPLDSPPERIGRQLLQMLVAMDLQECDPWSLPLTSHDQYLRQCVPDDAVRRSYEPFLLSTQDAHWLAITKVYDDLDDTALLLQATLRLGLSERAVGTWLLRLVGAYQVLRRSHVTWWRPLPEEERFGW